MDIEEITNSKGQLIDDAMNDVFKGNIPNLYDAIKYHIDTGGKRIRPILAILTYEALGKEPRNIAPFAAACEVLHNWILVHDDIEDGDKMRREKPTVWVKYGIAHGINVGDLMAHKVFELILKSDFDEKTILKLTEATMTAAIKTAEGQAMDINLRDNNSPTENDYMRMITGKTAHYLTLPMVGAAVAAGSKQDMINKMIEFGKFIGPAFQITDDVLDLTEGKGRGEIGRDIKEGKRSILVIHCLSKCTKEERKKIIEILNKSPEKTSSADVAFAKKLFEKYKSIEYARNKAESFAAQAKKIADTMPRNLKEILYFFADYLVKRKK
ncbi:MAG: polyprenyl synthetase family protein [Candidatus Aenigmarchaeota archaeon]|nr:polyprenyl synthetase family protein [Candidatus Aenigmarchaeota archaeon]